MTKPTAPATTDAAISEHPWPRTDEERVTFANAASKAWKEHKAAGGKKDDANYPLVLVSFDAWKAAGSPVNARRSTSRAKGVSGAGRKRLNANELRETVIRLGKDGGSVKPSMILRRIRAEGNAASLAALKELVPELIKSGDITEPAKPEPKPKRASGKALPRGENTKPPAAPKAKATKAPAKKAAAKTPAKPDPKKVEQAKATAAKKAGRPVPAPKAITDLLPKFANPSARKAAAKPTGANAPKQVTPIPKKSKAS